MLEKLPLLVKFFFVLSLALPLSVSKSFAQNIPPEVQRILRDPNLMRKIMEENQPKGEMTFSALPPQQYFQPPAGLAAKYKPYENYFQSGAALGYELDKCVESGKEAIYIKNMYVLYLDEQRLDSTLTTNQKERTAGIKLKGLVEHWRGKCNSDELQKVGISKGGLDFNFVNAFHLKPRWFSSSSGSGRFFAAGLDEVLKGASQKGEPVAFSYAKSENKSSFDTKILDALRKAGYPIPNVNPAEYEKAAQDYLKANGISLNLDKAAFYGRLESLRRISLPDGQSSAAIQVDFGITSGFEADMLVYRPEGLATASETTAEIEKNFIQKVSYNPDFSNLFAQKNSKISQPQTTNNYLLIPDGLQNKVGAQAFVNVDNDDRDDTFDHKDSPVAGKDDDLVRVVLRLPQKPPAQRTGLVYFRAIEGKDFIEIWEDPNKSRRFVDRGLKEIDSSVFVDGTGDFKNYRIKELWVEGIKAQEITNQQTKFQFTYSNNALGRVDVEETFEMTVIGIEKIDWEGEGNSINNDDNLDTDVNHRNLNDRFTNSIDPAKRDGRTFPAKCGGKVESTLKNPEAVRVFPGRRVEGGGIGTKTRDFVKVKVKLSVPPVEPVSVYFRSFDADDPSDNSQTPTDSTKKVVDDESMEEDNRGTAKSNNSKVGYFAREDSDGIVQKEFSAQEATLAFQVTMQPGDNFRIVGSADKKFLKNLINPDQDLNMGGDDAAKNENKQRIVDKSVFAANRQNPANAEIYQPKKYASKVLTVWRFFHVEVDYMGQITENKLRGTVVKIENNTFSTGQTKIDINLNLLEDYKDISTNVSIFENKPNIVNAFQEGKIRIGGGTYDVLYNSARGRTNADNLDYIVVNGDIPQTARNSTFFIWDDDEKWGFKPGIQLRDVLPEPRSPSEPERVSIEKENACYVAERFLPAYVVPDFTSLIPFNQVPTVDFVRNVRARQIGPNADAYFIKEHYKFDLQEFDKSPDFWTVYLLFGYKGATYEDGDPDGGSPGNLVPNTTSEGVIEGFTDLDFTGIMVFLEGVVERNNGYQVYNGYTGEEDCIAHEIGHIFGAKHEHLGLMGADGAQDSKIFTAITLNTIRSAKHP